MSDKSYTDMARDTLSNMRRRLSNTMQPGDNKSTAEPFGPIRHVHEGDGGRRGSQQEENQEHPHEPMMQTASQKMAKALGIKMPGAQQGTQIPQADKEKMMRERNADDICMY